MHVQPLTIKYVFISGNAVDNNAGNTSSIHWSGEPPLEMLLPLAG
jgi:hypothetical protein